jgi:hypothetical protein
MSELAFALDRLNTLIDGGWEFPDAAAKVAVEEGVDYRALVEAYDSQFN